MKILFVSPHGKGLSLAYRLKAEAHDLALYAPLSVSFDLASTFSISTDLDADAKAADLVIFDGNGMGKEADALRAKKIRVWGGSWLSDRMEADPEFALDCCTKLGIDAQPQDAQIAFEGFFSGKAFAYPYSWTIEDRYLLTGDLGPEVEFAGSVSRNIRGGTILAGEAFLKPLAPLFAAAGYSGPVRVSCGFLDDGKGYVASVSTRIHPESTLALHPHLGDAISSCQLGSSIAGGMGAYHHVAALRLYVQPYPLDGRPVPILFDAGTRDFVPHMVRIEGAKMTLTESPIVGVTLGKSPYVDKAVAQCVRRARQVRAPGLSYRLDIGHRVEKTIFKLDNTGWLR